MRLILSEKKFVVTRLLSPIEGFRSFQSSHNSFRSLFFSPSPLPRRMTGEKVQEHPARQIAGHCDPDRWQWLDFYRHWQALCSEWMKK